MKLCGHFVEAGTSVGIAAPVISHNAEIYGPGTDEFRPERWLDASDEQLKAMDRYSLTVCCPCLPIFPTFQLYTYSPIFPQPPTSSSYIICTVRPRLAHLHRQEHLHHGDLQIPPTGAPILRGRVGVGEAGLGGQGAVVLEADGDDC